MKLNCLHSKLLLVFFAAGCLLGIFPGAVSAQIPVSDNVLMGYIDESYYGDYVQDKYDFFVWDLSKGDEGFQILPSLLKNTMEYGTVVAGTWVEDAYYCITYAVEEDHCLYLSYEPLSRNVRIFGQTPVYMSPAVGCDMAYDPVAGKLYALSASTTGTALYELSLTDNTAVEIKGNTGSSGITVDGVVPYDSRFVGLGINSRGEMYSVLNTSGNAELYKVDPRTASATKICELDIPAATYSNSLTFTASPDSLYWFTSYWGDYVRKIDLETGKTTQVSEKIQIPVTSIFYPRYENGAPASAIADLRVIKNPSDYQEATFYYTLPSVDMQGVGLSGKLRVEIWRGTDESDMELIDSVLSQEPGAKLSYTHSEEADGMYYFAFRVRSENGKYSSFSGIYCPFFNVSFPYRTSFEIDDEMGVPVPEGAGWIHYENVPFQWGGGADTLVRTGRYSYGVSEDNVSKLNIGSGLSVYKGAEYEFSFYVVGHAEIIYGGRWIEGPEEPLEIVYDGNDTLLMLPESGTVGGDPTYKPYQHFAKHTFRFVAKENGPLQISFRAVGNDSYYIDDFEVLQLTKPLVPAQIGDLAVSESGSDLQAGKACVGFTAPELTLGGEDLQALSGVVVEWSPSRMFADGQGRDYFVADTVKNINPGDRQTVTRTFEDGFYYARAYAWNEKGSAPYSSVLPTGYLGRGVNVDFEILNAGGEPVADADLRLKPLYEEKEDDYTAVSAEDGKISLSGVYVGRYRLEVTDPDYEDFIAEIRLGKDTSVKVGLADRKFHLYPAAVSDLEVSGVDAESLTVSLSWTNPGKDADGNALENLDGVIVSYSLFGEELVVLDTVRSVGDMGGEGSAEIVLKEQGEYVLSVSAFNEYGVSDAVEVETGYVGSGFDKSFLCKSVDGEKVGNVRITLMAVNDTLQYAATGGEDGKVLFEGVRRGLYRLYATADYYDRMEVAALSVDNEEETVLDTFSFTLQQPEILALQMPDEKSVSFTWSLKEDRNFVDGFESYPDFEIKSIGDYKLGGAKTKGYFGGATWPNVLEEQSWIVFNPSATSPSLENEAYFKTRSGNKMLCSFFTVANDDWLAHRVDGGGILKFWAAGPHIDGNVNERFVVLYSVTDDNFGNFIRVSEGDYVEAGTGWAEYAYELPENAKYFAIHCVSDYANVLKIDDLSYTLSHGEKIASAIGFELYVDGTKVADLAKDKTTYTFSDLSDGTHVLGLKAVYEKGTSEMVTRTVVIGRQVADPVNVKVDRFDGKWILSYAMPAGQTAQYFKVFLDGKFLENIQETSYQLENVESGVMHKAGVCAVNNEHFSDTVWVEFGDVANAGMESARLNVYPNPAVNGIFSVELPVDGDLEIFAADGHRVYVRELAAGVHEINLESQPQGVYMVSFVREDGIRSLARVVVLR